MTAIHVPHNRLGLDYRNVPVRKCPGPIIDVHMHAHGLDPTRTFVQVADLYGISHFWTMAPLEDVDGLREAFPGRFDFIAIPRWQEGGPGDPFISDWMRRLDAFYEKGARLFKIHNAPGTKKKWQMDLEHPQMQRVIRHAYDLGYHFMTHIGDPKGWFEPGKPYGERAVFGSFESQFTQLEALLSQYPDRIHLGAHMGGTLEDLPRLASRLERFPNYVIDSSATKWMVRAIAEQDPGEVRKFILQYQDRILFGSDIVVAEKFDFDHYASRYWAHLHLWETDYQGESPIDDPDAAQPPQLVGLDLPVEVLEKLYWKNAQRWLPRKA